MSPEEIHILVRKLLDKSASAEEIAQIRTYLTENNIDFDTLLPWKDWDDTVSSPMPASTRERVLSAVTGVQILPQKMTSPSGPSYEYPQNLLQVTGHRKNPNRTIPLVAAATAAAIIVFLWIFPRNIPAGKPVRQQELIAWSTEKGQSRTVLLPDHSRAYLNAGSKITYSSNFGDSDRHISLSGEAFFEVAPLSGHPFIVKTGNLLTTVLGTTFNVKAYNNNSNYIIAVRSGKVKVAADSGKVTQEPCLLLPGQQISYANSSKTFTIQKVDTQRIASWKDNDLLFDGSSLREILETLEYRYNVRFLAAPGIMSGKEYSVDFYHLNLQESLDKLSILGKLNFQRRSDSLILVK
jgi:ferric-dicitrate binding protein FerR (iron transport regulator)